MTDTINYDGLQKLAESRGHTHIWGRHMIPGSPLFLLWRAAEKGGTGGFSNPPFGTSFQALDNYQWDAVVLQPFDRKLDGADAKSKDAQGDVLYVQKYIDRTLAHSPDAQIYIYARWPRISKGGKGVEYDKNNFGKDTDDPNKITDYSTLDDWDTLWQRAYTGGWDGSEESADYLETLTQIMRNVNPDMKKQVAMVPVGHVMYALNQKMKAGQVPGHNSIRDVYADGIHLNKIGSYIVAATFYAALYKENPRGLSGAPYKMTDDKLNTIIQDTVWDVVSKQPLAGGAPVLDTAPAVP